MTQQEIVAGMTADTLAEIKRRILDYCAAEGVLIPNEADLERILEPLRYQVATLHTDALERVRGRH